MDISTDKKNTAPQPKVSSNLHSRDIGLDAFRGLFLLLMTISHAPTKLRDFTVGYLGYISSAEGFVFLSGLVIGWTYTRYSLTQTESSLQRRAWLRARTIYFYHLATFIILFFFLKAFVRSENYWETWLPLIHQNFLVAFFLCATFLNQPKFLDILPMYVVFIAAAPLVINCFKKNKVLQVATISLAAWLLAQLGLTTRLSTGFNITQVPIYLGNFDIFGWQLLFGAGLYCGYLRQVGGWNPPSLLKNIFIIYSAALIILLFLCRHALFMNETIIAAIKPFTNKSTMGLVRLLNFAAFVFLIHCAPLVKPGFIAKSLAYLGRHSLQVFCFHLLLAVAMNLFLTNWPGLSERHKNEFVLLALISLYLPASICESLNHSRKSLPKLDR